MRSIGRYSLVAMVDVDEFLIPKKYDTLISMVESDPNYDEYNFLVNYSFISSSLYFIMR